MVAAHGRQYLVRLDDEQLLLCYPRGKKSELACGDRVTVQRTARDQGVIAAGAPRTSLLYRSNAFREKLLAANVTLALVVVAAEPAFSDELISRCFAAAEDQGITCAIVLNKSDLKEQLPSAQRQLAPFRQAGYAVVELCARAGVAELSGMLQGHTAILVGQSGMGKSTLINALIPDAGAITGEISAALDSGRHTTTLSRLYRLGRDAAIIDSPGLQVFGLAHLDAAALAAAFPEFRPHLGQCRFRDCRHDREPGCALRAATAEGSIHPRRLEHFHAIRAELSR